MIQNGAPPPRDLPLIDTFSDGMAVTRKNAVTHKARPSNEFAILIFVRSVTLLHFKNYAKKVTINCVISVPENTR